MAARPTRIIAWNARGLRGRKNELFFFLSDLNVDVAFIGETNLTPNDSFNIPSYEVIRTDRPARPHGRNPGGGTAILVRRSLVHRRCAVSTGRLEATGVVAHLGGTEVTLVATYHPPGYTFDGRTLTALLTGPGPIFVAGDMNAKHASWNSRVTSAMGRSLRAILDHHGDIVVSSPTEPTYIPDNGRGVPDVMDFSLSKNFPFQIEARTINDLSSDHQPVLFTIVANPTNGLPPASVATRTDWMAFHDLVHERLTPLQPPATAEELDGCVSGLHALLSSSVADASTPALPKRFRPRLPANIRREIR